MCDSHSGLDLCVALTVAYTYGWLSQWLRPMCGSHSGLDIWVALSLTVA